MASQASGFALQNSGAISCSHVGAFINWNRVWGYEYIKAPLLLGRLSLEGFLLVCVLGFRV